MEISLELLFHFKCDRCNKWWSVADLLQTNLKAIHCPHCGYCNEAWQIDYSGITKANENQAANLAQLLENMAAELRSLPSKMEQLKQ